MNVFRLCYQVAAVLKQALVLAFVLFVLCVIEARANELREGFIHPPDSARPWVLWYWMDGNITGEGITADLEAMQRVGLGGALIMDISQDIPPGPVRFGTPEWYGMFEHAVAEAKRLGLQISMSNDAGWCGSGGPWITPALAMQQVIWSQTNLLGPMRFDGLLPRLRKGDGFCRDIAVLAFPTLGGDGAPAPGFNPHINASVPGLGGTKLLDRNPATSVVLPVPRPGKPQYLQLEFTNAFTASRLVLSGGKSPQAFEGELQVSDDRRIFRTVRKFINAGARLTLVFEPVTARYFRVLITKADPQLTQIELSDVDLAPDFLFESFAVKSGLGRTLPGARPGVPASERAARTNYPAISLTNILDLTSKTDASARLEWEVPAGLWTVLRLGYMPVGTENHPAVVEGRGLECDKLSKAAIEAHFAGFLAKAIAKTDTGLAKAGTTNLGLSGTHIDSWETGCQNWTPQFREEFTRRRGYDPLRYLPAFSGRVVQSTEITERFLWDVRRTIADLLADNYAGHFADLAHQHGLTLSIEAYGNGPFDNLLYGSRADVPMGEFWMEEEAWTKGAYENAFHSCKSMACAAHLYGKPVVAAEAFTSYASEAKWQNHPFSLKELGDGAFCAGINRMVFQTYTHQPWLDRKPGMTMGPWGIHYERTETWWEQSKAWNEYLARCQFLLQQGLFVADICYLTDEGAFAEPPSPAQLEPSLPAGYNYDLAPPEALKRMSVKDGRLELPDGMSYRVLVLPATQQFTPGLLRKIQGLAKAGATIIGPRRAVKSPSLSHYPDCDREVKDLAQQLWSDTINIIASSIQHSNIPTFHHSTPSLQTVFAEVRLRPDFEQLNHSEGRPFRWIHRSVSGVEVYFVANPNPQPVEAECAFRVTGKQPEFWRPDTGEIESAAVWRPEAGRTIMPVKLDPVGSVFVVFARSSASVDPVVAVTRNGAFDKTTEISREADGKLRLLAPAGGSYELKTASGRDLKIVIGSPPPPFTVAGKWELTFPTNCGAPDHVTLDKLISWTDHSDLGVKYFSGTATYRTTLQVPARWIADDLRIFLDLGKVAVIAEPSLNGQSSGILWKPPFVCDITRVAKAGSNSLEVNVVNLWPNRLIGDRQLPEDCQWRGSAAEDCGLAEWPKWLLEGRPSPTGRITFATWQHWAKDAPLLESGLLGPVTLWAARKGMVQ